jgi:uncharacterized membrane protein (UPF0127 family)
MAQLINETTKSTMIEQLEIADTFGKRLKGLLGREDLSENAGLLIRHCNSIHTFFMKFSIDVLFLDKNLKVKKCVANIGPHELIWPVFGAHSVVELKAGVLQKTNTKVGDQLHVVL